MVPMMRLGGMPGGPTGGMGACSCDELHPCLGGTTCTATSSICLLETIIPGICIDGQPPPTMPAYACIDMLHLMGGLFSP